MPRRGHSGGQLLPLRVHCPLRGQESGTNAGQAPSRALRPPPRRFPPHCPAPGDRNRGHRPPVQRRRCVLRSALEGHWRHPGHALAPTEWIPGRPCRQDRALLSSKLQRGLASQQPSLPGAADRAHQGPSSMAL
eukprot:2943804-Rhodomonas_salina.2